MYNSLGNENYTGIAARDTANALTVLANSVRGYYLMYNSLGNENYTGIAARDTANALTVLANSMRGYYLTVCIIH